MSLSRQPSNEDLNVRVHIKDEVDKPEPKSEQKQQQKGGEVKAKSSNDNLNLRKKAGSSLATESESTSQATAKKMQPTAEQNRDPISPRSEKALAKQTPAAAFAQSCDAKAELEQRKQEAQLMKEHSSSWKQAKLSRQKSLKDQEKMDMKAKLAGKETHDPPASFPTSERQGPEQSHSNRISPRRQPTTPSTDEKAEDRMHQIEWVEAKKAAERQDKQKQQKELKHKLSLQKLSPSLVYAPPGFQDQQETSSSSSSRSPKHGASFFGDVPPANMASMRSLSTRATESNKKTAPVVSPRPLSTEQDREHHQAFVEAQRAYKKKEREEEQAALRDSLERRKQDSSLLYPPSGPQLLPPPRRTDRKDVPEPKPPSETMPSPSPGGRGDKTRKAAMVSPTFRDDPPRIQIHPPFTKMSSFKL
mmetsp:Transcript_24014/g.24256  ORF Transcript_24014/g.24256 Transcript_24014/m.24256 type:complete len:418 (+) Transcript_24014:94-1347(+)|eukprot:CAMPEP_0182428438 /NCGR_PEP_ID=MMETSP1167-20130531/23027_1 /TAXON_ID=2988 /ORGANISM="Mallomonas Sp, Strain CCMP3275" /LENGTH=417 /DNA_ID=CAMNT_0024611365 /DNA_START=93 /DNA_END=1346 /DNA_ORIENTATION=+